MDLTFLDLETTGLEAKKDSIIEISFIRYIDEKEVARVDEIIIPTKTPLTPFVTNLTGITEQDIEKEGKNFTDLQSEIIKKIGDSTIVGHNIDFDINFLIENGIPLEKNERIDTHEVARIVLPGETSFALEVLSQKYGFVHEDAHRAMSDVEACRDLFGLLTEKINTLPKKYLTQIRPFLESKTQWHAKNLFLASPGSDTIPKTENTKQEFTPETIPEKTKEFIAGLTPEQSGLLRIGNNAQSANFTKSMAHSSGRPTCIITPKLYYFQDGSIFPTPQVIFDPHRLSEFLDKRKTCSNEETTFYLKCAYRHFLGFRGLTYFDLFFMEKKYWNEVCLTEETHPLYKEICEERAKQPVIVCSPQAFLDYKHLDIFADRCCIFDEAEQFARTLLEYPTKTISLQSFLEHNDETIATKTLFTIKNLCKELIEEKLEHTITPFPERVLLNPQDAYPHLAEQLQQIDPKNEALKTAAEVISTPNDQLARWLIYYPESGNLTFNTWNPREWKELKSSLNIFPKLWLHRHKTDPETDLFFKLFLAQQDLTPHHVAELFTPRKIRVPKDIVSASSPEYNTCCNEKILEHCSLCPPEKSMAINFSSGETLKKSYIYMGEKGSIKNHTCLGERVSGGDGKFLEKFKEAQSVCFFHQRFCHPDLETKDYHQIIVQKYAFLPPSPLQKSLEKLLKSMDINFFGAWIMPQVAANLARTIGTFPSAEEIIFLDPRENTRWGKQVLKMAV